MKTIELLHAESFRIAETIEDKELLSKGWESILHLDEAPIATTSTGDLIVEIHGDAKLIEHGVPNEGGVVVDSCEQLLNKIHLLEDISLRMKKVTMVSEIKALETEVKSCRSETYKTLPRFQYGYFWKNIFTIR